MHTFPLSTTWCEQQFAFPPGNFLHSLPPHVPQLAAQHATLASVPDVFMMPPARLHSAAGPGPGGPGGPGGGGGGGGVGGVGGPGGPESEGSKYPVASMIEHCFRLASSKSVLTGNT